MPSEETVHVSPMKVTPTLGKGTLGTWSFHSIHGQPDSAPVKAFAEDETRSWANQTKLGRMRISA